MNGNHFVVYDRFYDRQTMLKELFIFYFLLSHILATKWYGLISPAVGHCNVDWYEPFDDITSQANHSIPFTRRKNVKGDEELDGKSIMQNEATILQYLAGRSGLQVNTTDNLLLPHIAEIETAPELALSLIMHSLVYKRKVESNTFSVQTLLAAYEDVQTLWRTENNQAINRMRAHLTMERFVKHQERFNDILVPLQTAFVSCLKQTEYGEPEILNCLEEIEWLTRLYKNQFMLYYDRLPQLGFYLSHKDIHDVETNLLTFRNYVNLRVKVYLVMFSTLKQIDGKISRIKLGYFSDKLIQEVGQYLKYVETVDENIQKLYQNDPELNLNDQHCVKSPTSFGRGVTCYFNFCKSSQEKCSITVNVFQKEGVEGAIMFEAETKDPLEAGKTVARSKAKEFYKQYQADIQKAIKNRWSTKMSLVVKTWSQIRDRVLISNGRFIKEVSKQNFSYKLKSSQAKAVNILKAQIDAVRSKRHADQKDHGFVKHTANHDEL